MRARGLWVTLLGMLFASAPARAGDVPLFAGDIGIQYGRNWSQELMIAGLVGEFKVNVLPFVSVGARTGGQLGVSLSANATSAKAKAFTNLPIALKGEVFLGTAPTRPYAGLSMGVSRATGAGAIATTTSAASYAVQGPMPTLVPEIGLDLGHFRIALAHAWLVGSGRKISEGVTVSDNAVTISDDAIPNLSGTTLQLGLHFGGPKD